MLRLLNSPAIYLEYITGVSAYRTSIPQFEWYPAFKDITLQRDKVQINGTSHILSVIFQSLYE